MASLSQGQSLSEEVSGPRDLFAWEVKAREMGSGIKQGGCGRPQKHRIRGESGLKDEGRYQAK